MSPTSSAHFDGTAVAPPLGTGPVHCKASPALSTVDLLVWLGDFNYRIDVLSQEEVVSEILSRNWGGLLAYDQLLGEMAAGRVFAFMREGKIDFPPTYKFDRGSFDPMAYDSGEKRRVPAWCDRVVFRDGFCTSLVKPVELAPQARPLPRVGSESFDPEGRLSKSSRVNSRNRGGGGQASERAGGAKKGSGGNQHPVRRNKSPRRADTWSPLASPSSSSNEPSWSDASLRPIIETPPSPPSARPLASGASGAPNELESDAEVHCVEVSSGARKVTSSGGGLGDKGTSEQQVMAGLRATSTRSAPWLHRDSSLESAVECLPDAQFDSESPPDLLRPVRAHMQRYDCCLETVESDHKLVRCVLDLEVAFVDHEARRRAFAGLMRSSSLASAVSSRCSNNGGVVTKAGPIRCKERDAQPVQPGGRRFNPVLGAL